MTAADTQQTARTKLADLLIAGVVPYFVEKPARWFADNERKLKKAALTEGFFASNSIVIEQNEDRKLSRLLRTLDELGYEKVERVEDMGEFAHRGNLIEVFPVNRDTPVRIELYGNTVEHIEELTEHKQDEENARERLKHRVKRQERFSDLRDLSPGDYLVHLDHGVGQFRGMEPIGSRTYYVIEYAKGDTLFVPVDMQRKLSRYVGFAAPRVSRLGSAAWFRTKRKAKEEAEQFARELLNLYAQRETAERSAYNTESLIERELASSFPYEETPDQAQAIRDVEKDMEATEPMDRIVCGDVGFGKTEVAVRAMGIAVGSGKQAALLTPTTILAAQHYHTIAERMEHLPLRVALLSRLQSAEEQKRVIADIREGTIDIVIGTHRLLSEDIRFDNLGLLVIDEEQRFGVKQKEHFKQARASLDVLSLSATPIPRTLYLALSSLRDISFVQTPPAGRKPIETIVEPWSRERVREAIDFEVQRGGQVYYLHNRVATLEQVRRELAEMDTGNTWKTAVLHGQLSENQMMRTMERFRRGDTNVLATTTIIENGLDLPNVNTLIVSDSSQLGLAQAYQLRGRIGREARQAYAYFLHGSNLTDEARQRLEALREAQEPGSGYAIARRDLEIRGAGNILGKEQAGSVNAVGLNLYCQMVADAVEKEQAKQ